MTIAALRWTDPVTRIDGAKLAAADISGIEIHDTHSDGSSEVLGTVLAGVQQFTTGILGVGDHAFTVVVKDKDGHASSASNVAVVSVPATLAAPSAVTDLAASLIN